MSHLRLTGRRIRYRYGQHVAAARHSLEDLLIAVSQGDAHVADTLRERLVGHDHGRPARAAADDDVTDHDHALLIGKFLPATRKGHATACPYFF